MNQSKDQPFDQMDGKSEPKTPKLAQSEAQKQAGRNAELHRIACLNRHVRITLDEATAALNAGDPDKALDILEKASGKYVRFGGATPYWKERS